MVQDQVEFQPATLVELPEIAVARCITFFILIRQPVMVNTITAQMGGSPS